MAITISGNGITSANIADGTITNADINASAAIDASKLTGTGKVLQVLQTVVTNQASVNPSSSWTDWTGLSVTITPSSTSSKILVTASVNTSAGNNHDSAQRLMRDSTPICIGDSYGSWLRATTGGGVHRQAHEMTNYSINYLDSPATTSATTYKLQCWDNTTMWLNRENNSTFYSGNSVGASTITVMEIGA